MKYIIITQYIVFKPMYKIEGEYSLNKMGSVCISLFSSLWFGMNLHKKDYII